MLLLLPLAARAEVKERIAAVVNGQPIALTDVEERVAPELTRLKGKLFGPQLAQQRKEVLERGLNQLVDEKLVEGEASTLGIDVPEEDVQRLISELAKQNGMDAAQFKEALTAQGIEFETVRESLKRQQLMLRLLQYKVKPRKVSDEEVQSAYAAMSAEGEVEVRARHLFVSSPDGAPAPQQERARLKAEEAVRRLQQGESFAKVARDLSEGPGAAEGGDLGYFRRGQMLQAIDQAAFALKASETSKLIRTTGANGGYHLVHVEDRRKVNAKPLAEVQEELRNKLANESVLKEREHYLSTLRKSAQIDLKL